MTTRTIVGDQRKAVSERKTPGKRGPYNTKRRRAEQEQLQRAQAAGNVLDPEVAALLGFDEDDSDDDDFGVDLSTGKKLDIDDVFSGVSVSWLAYAFQMDRNTVKKRLNTGGCQPIRQEKGAKFYNLKQAAQYLVEPKVDIEKWIKSLNPKDLPPLLQDSYWSAAIKRQKWEETARMTWRHEQVVEVLGRVAKDMKTNIMLFADNVEREIGLTPSQRKIIMEQSDGLMEMLYKTMVEQPQRYQTQSTIVELETAAEQPDV